MNSSTVESPAMKMKKRGSLSRFTDMARDMVNGLDLRDDAAHVDRGTSNKPQQSHSTPRSSSPVRTKAVRRGSAWSRFSAEDDSDPKPQQNNDLPSMHNEPSPMRAVRRGSGWSLFSAESDYNPSNMDLKSQAKQQSRSIFPSTSISIPTKKGQSKRDPLMEFHKKHSIAEDEYKKQKEAEERRRQCRDHDEDKSVGSMSSLFDFLTSSGAAAQLTDESSNDGTSVAGVSTQSMTNFMGLFGDDAEEISKLSSPRPAAAGRAEEQSLHSAVRRSKSVKGNRVYLRGVKEAEKGDWKKAVAYYHIALVKQRKYYGEDHIVTSNTLNALGVALMHLGEHFGALTALEEALQIRQELLGAGAEEVAEATSNIWLVLKASQDD